MRFKKFTILLVTEQLFVTKISQTGWKMVQFQKHPKSGGSKEGKGGLDVMSRGE